MSTKITQRDLSNYQPLNTLNPENLKEICDKLTVAEIPKGDNIFIQGDSKDDHIFLHDGVVELVENKIVVKTLESGTDDTKTALAHIIPRNFSAVAKTNVNTTNFFIMFSFFLCRLKTILYARATFHRRPTYLLLNKTLKH